MLRIKDDDAVAFEILVARYQSRIARLMMGWVHSQEVAEELVQEVFLRVFRSRKSYEPTAKFTTWIYRIANNVASNNVRDRSKRKEYQVGLPSNPSMTEMGIEHIALAASGAMPTRIVDRSERAEVVQQAVMALGERQRVALILSRFENMSYQEIADTMGLTVKAVKSLLSRARVNLKTLLQPYMDDGSGLAFPGAANSAATDEQGMEDDDQVIAKGDSV